MYTILRLEENKLITYIMILVDDNCSSYDYLTYDYTKALFVDECFTTDSFQTERKKVDIDKVKCMITKIGRLIEERGLEYLMYNEVKEHDGISIEAIHIPENYTFKNDYL